MNFTQARQNMVDGQLRTNKVTDYGIIDAFKAVPREEFVSREQKSIAYVDEDLPLKFGQSIRYMMEPMVLARLIQAADIKDDDLVLDVGCLTGYSTAILSRLCGEVTGIDSNSYALNKAKETCKALGYYNITLKKADLETGIKAKSKFDVILFSGALPEVPEAYFDMLANNGRLLAVIDENAAYEDNTVGQAVVWQKIGKGAKAPISLRELFDAQVKPLPGFEQEKGFQF